MNRNTNFFSLRNNYDAAIAGLFGAFLIYLFAKYGGIGLSPDSIVYISTARNVVQGNGFYEFSGQALTDFPIGYPAFLSIILFISKVDLVASGLVINMVLFFTLIYLSGGIIHHISTKNKWIRIPFLVLISFSPSLLGVYTMLWSETLFLVMTLIFIICIHKYGEEKTLRTLLIVSVIAGLTCIVRLAGVTLLGAGGLLIILDRKLDIKNKFKHLIIFGTIGSSFLIINFVRNYLNTDTLAGPREKSLTSLFQNIERYSNVMSEFFHFQNFPVVFVISISILFFAFYVFSHVVHLYKTERYYNYWNICAVYFIVYSLFMVVSATFSRYEELNVRLLSPLYLPCLLPFTFIITWLIEKFNGWKKIVTIVILSCLFSSIVYSQYMDNAELYEMAKDCGIPGYAEDTWKQSQLLSYIKKDKQHFNANTKIYSDGNEAVYLFTGLSAKLVPHVESKKDNFKFNKIQQFDYYLVWIYENANSEILSLKTILKKYKLIKVASFPEGCIYHHPAPVKIETTNIRF